MLVVGGRVKLILRVEEALVICALWQFDQTVHLHSISTPSGAYDFTARFLSF